MRIKRNGLLLSSISASAMVILIKFIGFVKQIIVAAYYGSSLETDVFFLAYGWENTITQIAFSAIQIAALTIYLDEKNHGGEHKASLFISSVLTVFIPISIIMAAFTFGFSLPIAKVLAPKYELDDLKHLALMIRMFTIVTVCSPVITSLSTVFNAEKKFVKAQISTLLAAIIDIVMIVVFAKSYGIWARNFAFVLSNMINVVLLVLMVKKYIKVKVVKKPFDQNINRLLKLSVPIMLGNGMTLMLTMVDRTIGSFLDSGNVSALNYASSLYSILIAVVSTGLVTVLTTYFATDVSSGKIDKMVDTLQKSVRIVLVPMTLACIIAYVLSGDIIALVFQRGSFTKYAVDQTSNAVKGYIIAALFVVGKDIFIRGHYALKDTKSPVINNIASGIVNIIASIVLVKQYGVMGITMGTALAEAVAMILCIFTFKRTANKYSRFSTGLFVKSLIPFVIAMVFTGLVAFFMNDVVLCKMGRIGRVFGVSVFSCIVYLGCLKITKCKEMDYILSMVKKNE